MTNSPIFDSNLPSYCIFGAAPDTNNLGVTALHDCIVRGLRSREPDCEITVFDHGLGPRFVEDAAGGGTWRIGAQPTRRVWRPTAITNMRVANALGGAWNRGMRRIRAARAVLDLSAGDSFSDIYGQRRFDAITAPKSFAAGCGVPLVLLPQTYGPFRSPQNRSRAAALVRSAAVAWARDARSFEAMKELLGPDFDPDRHRLGVDLAFGLEPLEPAAPLSEQVESWLAEKTGPVVGINVSGLVYLDPARASGAFGIKLDYAQFVGTLVRRLLEDSSLRVVLVPHVLAPIGHYESDLEACNRLLAELEEPSRQRIAVLGGSYSPAEIKHLISRLDWFCGTRMHSTIAALSTGTPVAALAYSPKFQGVFDRCAVGDRVLDLKSIEAEQGIEHLLHSFRDRRTDEQRLSDALPDVRSTVKAQLDSVLQLTAPPRSQAHPDS